MVVFHGKLYDAGMTEQVRPELPDWIRTLAASRPFGVGDRRGDGEPHRRRRAGAGRRVDQRWPRTRDPRPRPPRLSRAPRSGLYRSSRLQIPTLPRSTVMPEPPPRPRRGRLRPALARLAAPGRRQLRDKIVIVSPALTLDASRVEVYRFIYVSPRIRRSAWRFLSMVSSGSTAATRALPTGSRGGRTPFRTMQASWDQVDESRTMRRGGHPGPDILPVGRVGYRKSYIAGKPAR